jgi:putative sporulation protein YtxC
LKILSLGFSGMPDEIKMKLAGSFPGVTREGLPLTIQETKRGSYYFLDWNIPEGELSFRNYERVKNTLKSCAAEVLADSVIEREEAVLLRKIANRNYRHLGEEERDAICEKAVALLDSCEQSADAGKSSRRNDVLRRLRDYFDNQHELVLDGFIAFRLKDYREKLAEIVDRAVDEYMMDLEYKEFIRVLRYFVDVQQTQVDEVHVIICSGEVFKIRDSRGKVINNQYLETFMVRNTDEINYEDLLISALITIAPQIVMLHCGPGVKADDVVTTIQRVFEGRVVRCSGCDLCRNDSLERFTP